MVPLRTIPTLNDANAQETRATVLRLTSDPSGVLRRIPDDIIRQWIRNPAHFIDVLTNRFEISFYRVSAFEGLTQWFVWAFAPFLHWKTLWATQWFDTDFLEELIRVFPQYCDWWEISVRQPMTLQFLNKYGHCMSLHPLSFNLYLPEEFIRAHADQLEWTWITTSIVFEHKPFTDSFVIEFQERLSGWVRLPPERLFPIHSQLAPTRLNVETLGRLIEYGEQVETTMSEATWYLEDWLVLWATNQD